MVWAREHVFVAELTECLEKASTGRLERLAGIAIDDDKQVCHVTMCWHVHLASWAMSASRSCLLSTSELPSIT